MASKPESCKPHAKPSFAKVAASNYRPAIPKSFDANAAAVTVDQSVGSSNAVGEVTGPLGSGLPDHTTGATKPAASSKPTPTVPSNPSVKAAKAPQVGERSLPGSTRISVIDDNSTQVSSSEGSAKVPSLDGKSTASGTTFAMDEKESLRPDDSASLRAVEEEDAFSPSASVDEGSRSGSVSGAQAFRDQLQEIAVIDPMSKRFPREVAASAIPVSHADGNPGDAFSNPLPQYTLAARSDANPTSVMPQPDEKLIEALQSYRDRVWVLKLEQDVLDFIKNPSEQQLDLPQCNSFYRMLAHRMADYYMLRHTLDPTGNAVRIHKTDFHRLPPPLCSWPVVSTLTPPPSLPARTIMRRSDDGKNTPNTDAANSGSGSKATSDAGADSTSEVGPGAATDTKTKAQMTREEREAKYKEARMRIFGSSEETENAEAEANSDNADVSRSSSVAGKKKMASKKQRNYDNDGFEARSQFNPYYGGSHTYVGPDNYYLGYSGMVNNSPYQQNGSNPVASSGSYPSMPQSGDGMGWQQPPFMGPAPNSGGSPMYTAPNGQVYDLSADFQRGMQAFQSATGSPHVPMRYPVHNGQPKSGFSMQQYPQSWSNSQHMPALTNTAPGMGPNPMSFNYSSGPTMPYPQQHSYGMPPGSLYANGSMSRMPSGGYPNNRPQFNPQSQSFIPGSQNPANMGHMLPHNGLMGSYQSNRNFTPSSNHNSSAPLNGTGPSSRAQQNGHIPQSNNPINLSSAGNNQTPGGGVSHSLTHPLPPPPPNQSSISKWGTPSSLPQKPPPPASMQPQKFIETHRGTPPHAIPGMPRTPSVAGMLGITPMAMFTGNGMSNRGSGQK